MKVLVIGCGSIGRRHAMNAARLAATAVVDSDSGLAARVAAETGARHFDRIEDALAWGPDRVVVAVPNDLHVPLARRTVQAGADVLIEKPIAHA
ncbi:MAG: Gfo/Idh/MocA family oxidoreductase, partial [Thermodesulfobacteriota bacterium]